MIDQSKKIVIVTGSSGGIGMAICKKFKQKDYIVLGIDIQQKDNSYIDYFYNMDISNQQNIDVLVDDVTNRYKKVNCLINNAGIAIYKSIKDTTKDDFLNVINTNLTGVFLLSKNLFPLINKVNGNIVNIGSVHSVATSKNIAAYSATKSAIMGITKNMAIEFGPYVRVNCVSPGAVKTDMLKAGLSRNNDVLESIKKLEQGSCLNRISEPADVANVVYFVASKYANSLTGTNIVADNGASIKLASE